MHSAVSQVTVYRSSQLQKFEEFVQYVIDHAYQRNRPRLFTDSATPTVQPRPSLLSHKMQHILNIPLPIIFTFLEHLSVEEVWELRVVCKSFYHICTSYLKEKLKDLCLDKTWFYNELFGRTVNILQNCRNLKVLTMELQHSISTDKVLTIFHCLLKSTCNLSECSWKSFRIPDSSLIPNITENFVSVRKLCLVDLVCSDWQRLFVCLLQPTVQYTTLQHLSLQLPRYDGADLLYLGRNCPNVTTLNVSNRKIQSRVGQPHVRGCLLHVIQFNFLPADLTFAVALRSIARSRYTAYILKTSSTCCKSHFDTNDPP